ncbi:MAG: GBS Bsp-like repeat-containing protein [Clostridia bacterium]|nr:GBS Bsp-like repeat-containing protein [Clostridia bacterium]
MKNIRGISLITLIITIIVIVIIATAVILTASNGIGESASKARFMNDMNSIEQAINLYKTSKYANNQDNNINPIDTDKGEAGIVDISTLSADLITHMEQVLSTTIDTKQGKLYYVKLSDLELNINSGPTTEGGYITKSASIIQDMDTGKIFYEQGQDIGNKRWYSVYGGTEVAREEVLPTLQMEATPAQEEEAGSTTEVNVKLTANNANKVEYSLDGETYSLYQGSFKVYDNGVVYGRALNAAGEVTDQLDIVNIKKEPDISIVTNPEQTIANKPSGNVTVTINTRNADVVQYSFDGETYSSYSSPFVVNTNGTIYAKAINTYGQSEATIEIITIGDEPYIDINAKWDSGNEGNEPLLTKGENSTEKILKPVEWTGNQWIEVTNLDKSWYSYKTESQYWANAQSSDGSMWVWIPRFAYKITSGTHSSSAGVVDIKFIQGSADAPTGYTLASAFEVEPKEGEKLQLQGIWVAKFEASRATYKDANNKTKYRIQVKPGVGSWRLIALKDAFNYCINMKTDSKYGFGTDGISIDTHLIKNREWDAIEYLTQSKYGRNGEEVWINNNYYLRTGYSGKTATPTYGAALNTTTFAYDNTKYGVNASTTKNVYGIYDMAGGSEEMVASYVNNNHRYIKYTGGVYSGLDKYFDKYPSSQLDKDNSAKLPNATVRQNISSQNYELLSSLADKGVYNTSGASLYKILNTNVNSYSSWYGDYSVYPQNSAPFILRGGLRPGTSQNARIGMYSYRSYSGYGSGGVGFRPVLTIKEDIEAMPDRVTDPSIYITSRIVEEGMGSDNPYGTDIDFPEYENNGVTLRVGEKVVISYPKESEYMYYKRWTGTAEPATWTLVAKNDINMLRDENTGIYYYSITNVTRTTKFKAYCSKGPSSTDSNTDYLEVMYDTTKPGITISQPSKTYAKAGDIVTYSLTFTDNSNELNDTIITEENILENILVKTGSIIISDSEILKTVRMDPNNIHKWYVDLTVESEVTRNISGVKIEIQKGMIEDSSGNRNDLRSSTTFAIDNASPTITFSPNGGFDKSLSSKVTVSDVGGSGIDNTSLQYIWTASETEPTSGWITFTNGATLTSNENMSQYLWIKGKDKAGNEVITHSNLFEKDVTAPDNPIMLANPTGWTSGNVTVTITYPSDVTVKEYSLNGTTWSNYTTPVVVTTNNTTVYARGKDSSGNTSEASTLTVTNIDRTSPGVPTVNLNGYTSGSWTSSNVTLTFSTTDSQSGIQKYQYSLNGTSGWIDVTSPWVINTDGQRNIWIRAIDNAGNIGPNSSMVSVNRDTTAPTYTSYIINNVTEDGYDVYVYGIADSASGINRVQFPTWTNNNGQDDIQSNWSTNPIASGQNLGNGTWYYRVNRSDHNNEYGIYSTNIYIYDNNGYYTTITTSGATITQVVVEALIDEMTVNNFDKGSIYSGTYWTHTAGTSNFTCTYNRTWGYNNTYDRVEVSFHFNSASYGTNYRSDINFGLFSINYHRDYADTLNIMNGSTITTFYSNGNFVSGDNTWRFVLYKSKAYELYKNGSLLTSGYITTLPSSQNFGIWAYVANKRVYMDYIRIKMYM